MNDKIIICVVTYNRPNSLRRLLNSLSKSYYPNNEVTLYISIDKDNNLSNDNKQCYEIANNFNWNYGEKIIDYKKENLGLKRHIIECGNLTNEYDNIIVLEDDIVVSPSFYLYALNVLKYYKSDINIGGFSLYSFPKNPFNRLPFYPLKTDSDVYFMQYACSWGQMWTKKQWNSFFEWYIKNKDCDLHSDSFPEYIANWNNSSWLKYFMRYLVDSNKFFVYPYDSFSTNFSDIGTHNKISDIAFQTNLVSGKKVNYFFKNFNDSLSVYDSFFENIRLNKIINIKNNIDADVYDTKQNYKYNYVVSTKKYNYKIIKSFKLNMYSYEQNIINNIEGNDLFLYDISVYSKNSIKSKFNFYNYIFKIGEMHKKQFFGLFYYLIMYGLENIFNKLKK